MFINSQSQTTQQVWPHLFFLLESDEQGQMVDCRVLKTPHPLSPANQMMPSFHY